MFYRENGQFKTTYRADQQIFPIAQDRWMVLLIIAAAFLVVPMFGHDYMFRAILIPFLIMALAALGREHPGRVLRPDLAGIGRVHGGGCLCGVQLFRPRARACRCCWRWLSGGCCRRPSASCSACRACA
jgi:hypothetical protein